ncbi:MAG: RraA family protein [Gaiellales bacterium]
MYGVQITTADVKPTEHVERLRALGVAAVADALDRLGARDQVMHHSIRPLIGGDRVAGRAFTIASEPNDALLDDPYTHEIAAVDAVPAGAFVVIATQGSCEAAVWGELLGTVASRRGAIAAVSDGAVRDLAGLRQLALPTYAAAVSARDSAGRLQVTGHGGEVVCGGVSVASGDLVLADEDGVVVVPSALAEEAIAAAERKLSIEGVALSSLQEGTSLQSMYDEHRVL